MPVVIAWIIIIGLLVVWIHFGWQWFNTPTRGLRRDFRKLRRSILGRFERTERSEVKHLLNDCYRHLDAMCRAQYEHEVITRMVKTTEELSGVKAIEARQRVNAFRTTLSTRLAETFATLSRLSMAADLELDDPVDALRQFSKQLENERYELFELDPIAEASITTKEPAAPN